MPGFEPTIGLEIHAQLLTESKAFCACSARFGAPANTNVCPVCLGLPGALPVLNRRAVEYAVRAALALNCTIRPTSVFARKNYFYPDLPKGYQITQYADPLAVDGWLELRRAGRRQRIGIARVHLEEDAGKSLHHGFEDSEDRTYLDFNRSGVPLVEIVTRPELTSAADAAAFFSGLRAVLVALGVNDGNMEEGSLRCDANVSVRAAGAPALGTKTEVKNLNSFRHLQRALEHEIGRQIAVLTAGEQVRPETRLWEPSAGRTVAMRGKEEEQDYRYFPEPDLPPLELDRAWIEEIRSSLPELPVATRDRLEREYRIHPYEADVLTNAFRGAAAYFEEVVRAGAPAKAAANWILGEVGRALNDLGSDDVARVRSRIAPAHLAELIGLVADGRISGSVAKSVFDRMRATGRAPRDIVEADGLSRLDDEQELERVVRTVLEQHQKAVGEYRAGRTKAFGYLVGQVMKATGGRADPERVHRILRTALGEPPR